eukprot:8686343-Pyramimonas_sp.AAC.1
MDVDSVLPAGRARCPGGAAGGRRSRWPRWNPAVPWSGAAIGVAVSPARRHLHPSRVWGSASSPAARRTWSSSSAKSKRRIANVDDGVCVD